MPHYPEKIEYSDKYYDSAYEYRHVILPRNVYKKIRDKGLLSEEEWRALGISQSRGWVHYLIFPPEPNVLMFRRPIGTDPLTGLAPFEATMRVNQNETEKAKNLEYEANLELC